MGAAVCQQVVLGYAHCVRIEIVNQFVICCPFFAQFVNPSFLFIVS